MMQSLNSMALLFYFFALWRERSVFVLDKLKTDLLPASLSKFLSSNQTRLVHPECGWRSILEFHLSFPVPGNFFNRCVCSEGNYFTVPWDNLHPYLKLWFLHIFVSPICCLIHSSSEHRERTMDRQANDQSRFSH